MKFCNLAAPFPDIGLMKDDWLCCGPRQLHQFFSIFKTLQIKTDDLCLGILNEILKVINLIQIQLISHAYDFGDSDVGAGKEVDISEGDPTALGKNGDFPFADRPSLHIDEGDDKAVVDIDDPYSVGSDNPDPPFPGNLENLLLQLPSIFRIFPKAPRFNNCPG